MELQQARYFLALAQTLNFTRAAELSNVTQPSLTKAIQKLEHEFGGDLVFRERGATQVTELGRRVLPLLHQAVASADAARAAARDLRLRVAAPLRVGLAPTVSPAVLRGPMAALAHQEAGLEIELIATPTGRIDEALLEGEIHAALGGSLVAPVMRIDRWPLFEERYVAVVAQSHPFAQAAVIPLDRVGEAIWLQRIGCEVAEAFRIACFAPEDGPRIGHRATQDAQLQELALAGLGAFLAPERSRPPAGLVARPIMGDPVRQAIALHVVAGRRYTPALDAFIRLLRRWSWSEAAPAGLEILGRDPRAVGEGSSDHL